MLVTEITPQKEQRIEPLRLAAYCRVSSDSKDQLHSLAAQVRYYNDYAKHHPEFRLVEIYADEGITGTCMDARDDLNRLLNDCKRGKIDRIITKSVSRLARNTQDVIHMIRMLKKIGVSVYFEEQGLDTEIMSAEIFLTLPGMTAQQESLTISQNVRWSVRKRMAEGTYKLSRIPYGYIVKNGQLDIFEPEAEIVRRIFDMYVSGIGKCSIARLLNEEGIPSHNSKGVWHHSVIEYVLANERYIGDALLQKRFNSDDLPFRQIRNRGELPKFYMEKSNPPIISKEVWEAAQKIMQERNFTATRTNANNPLSKLLKCSGCGRVFIKCPPKDSSTWANKCGATGVHHCGSKRVKEEAVYTAFTRLVMKLKNHSHEIIDAAVSQAEVIQILTNENTARIAEIDSAISKLSSKILVITRLYKNGVLNQTEYSSQYAELNGKLTALRSERKKKFSSDDEALEDLRELRDMISEARSDWICDMETFRQIVTEIIVISNSEIRFCLLGGLEFTEHIDERLRCGSE